MIVELLFSNIHKSFLVVSLYPKDSIVDVTKMAILKALNID